VYTVHRMAVPVWKGRIAIGQISFEARLYTGARSRTPISFNQIHRNDGARIRQDLRCALENKAVPRDEVCKGFEYEKDRYALFEDAEIKAASPPVTGTIDLVHFIDIAKFDGIYFEESYYLGPDSDGEPLYAALFKALRRTGTAGLAHVVISTRDRYILFRAGLRGIIAHALYFDEELNELAEFRTNLTLGSIRQVAAIARIIGERIDEFEDIGRSDRYRSAVTSLVAAKVEALRKGKP
jgi:DNA end-binding protein Ku